MLHLYVKATSYYNQWKYYLCPDPFTEMFSMHKHEVDTFVTLCYFLMKPLLFM